MNLKTSLDALTMETTVLGGAVLGCGGGGKLEDGLYLGQLATAQGGACLIDPAALSDQANVAVVMPVHTSGCDTHQIRPTQTHRAVELLQDELEMATSAPLSTGISGLINGGLGAVESMIGWELSGFLGVPLLDSGIPSVDHPASLHNLLMFLQETAVTQAFTISLTSLAKQQEHVWRGRPSELLQHLVHLSTAEKKSYVAAVGPMPQVVLRSEKKPTSMSHALQVGRTVLAANDNGGEGVVAALQTSLPIQFSTFATVTEISWHEQGQDTYGHISMLDDANRHLQLTYNQRYTQLIVDGQQIAVFPDLIITLGILGTPLTGEEVFMGQDLYLLVAR